MDEGQKVEGKSLTIEGESLTTSEMIYNIVTELIDTETMVVVSLTVLALVMLCKVVGNPEQAGELMKYFGPLLGLIIGAFSGFVKGLRKGVRIGENQGKKEQPSSVGK